MRERLETTVERVSRFVDDQSAVRLLVKAEDSTVRSKFLDTFFERLEIDDISYDVLKLNPDGETIKVETTRQIKEFLSYPPTFARHRYVISDEITGATPEAISALLKITEEPPNFAVFVFFTANPSRVISTIRSRFVTISLSVDPEALVAPGALSDISDPILKSVVETVATAAVYHEKNPGVLNSFVKKLKDSLSGTDAALEAVKNEMPDFVVSLAAEEVLLSVKKGEIPMVLRKMRNFLGSDKSKKLSRAFADAALVIVQDLIVLKKTSYWKGVKRKNHIPRYMKMKTPERDFVERVIKIRNSNANEDVSIFLMLAKFAMLKEV